MYFIIPFRQCKLFLGGNVGSGAFAIYLVTFGSSHVNASVFDGSTSSCSYDICFISCFLIKRLFF